VGATASGEQARAAPHQELRLAATRFGELYSWGADANGAHAWLVVEMRCGVIGGHGLSPEPAKLRRTIKKARRFG
jgi:hypothetical protein